MYIFVKKKWFHRIVFGCDNENTREANKYSIDSILIVCDSLHGNPVAKWYQLISTSASFMALWCATVSSWLIIRKLISRSQHIVPNLSPSNVQPRISSLFKKRHTQTKVAVYTNIVQTEYVSHHAWVSMKQKMQKNDPNSRNLVENFTFLSSCRTYYKSILSFFQ